jgi:hypothetical protein
MEDVKIIIQLEVEFVNINQWEEHAKNVIEETIEIEGIAL